MRIKKGVELPKRWPFSVPRTSWYMVKEVTTITLIGAISKFWLRVLSKTQTKNLQTFSDLALKKVHKNRPLLTISNHHCCVDDPVLFGLLPFSLVSNPKNIRWTPGADEVMFYKDSLSTLFGYGRVVPTIRGWGMNQPSMDLALNKMNDAGWVHLFAEGKINLDQRLLRLKWGAARLLHEAKIPPIVLPIWHMGMDDLLPNKRPYIPQIGRKITFVVGKPIDFTEQLAALRALNYTRTEIRKRLTDTMEKELRLLQKQCEEMHKSFKASADLKS